MDKLLQWLNTKVNHYNESNNKELLDELFSHLVEWIIKKNITINVDLNDLLIHFYLFNYDSSILTTNNEYFDMMYHEDIINLFLCFREISGNYGSELYNKRGSTADGLLNFINRYIIIDDENDIVDINEELLVDDEY
tara:strand:- start:243 stop:653 length:411 start_codon:yes stop_codon:yes gene_type:complete